MEFIAAVLDSTNLDARNPCKLLYLKTESFKFSQKQFRLNFVFFSIVFSVIKEWSIFAIRNLCVDNVENQQIINQMTQVGVAKSNIVQELNIDLGSLRIKPNN